MLAHFTGYRLGHGIAQSHVRNPVDAVVLPEDLCNALKFSSLQPHRTQIQVIDCELTRWTRKHAVQKLVHAAEALGCGCAPTEHEPHGDLSLVVNWWSHVSSLRLAFEPTRISS